MENLFWYNKETVSTLEDFAAEFCCRIIQKHAFHDGNKRTALAVLDYILSVNQGRELILDEGNLADLFEEIADHKKDQRDLALCVRNMLESPRKK